MIILHQGDAVADRLGNICQAAADAGCGVFRNDPARSLADLEPEIEAWLKQQWQERLGPQGRGLLVLEVSATDAGSPAVLEAIIRRARWAGVDTHLSGPPGLEAFGETVVTDATDLPSQVWYPGRTTSSQSAHLDPPMQPFRRATGQVVKLAELMALTGMSEAEAKQRVREMESHEIWVNNLYQVNIERADPKDTGGIGFAHLIIRRLDRRPVHSWVHFQEIKNALLGPECEAVEMYPAERFLVDAKDHYHLWGFTSPEETFGIGFRDEREVRNKT